MNISKIVKLGAASLVAGMACGAAGAEEITKEEYEKRISKLKEIKNIESGENLTELECAGGACPIK